MIARIEYPDDFIDDLLAEFVTHPDRKKIELLARAGDLHALGKMLHEARLFDGTASRIHRLLYEGHHRQLEREAAVADRRERLYARWYTLYEKTKKDERPKDDER